MIDYSILYEEVWPMSVPYLCTGQEEHDLKLLVISSLLTLPSSYASSVCWLWLLTLHPTINLIPGLPGDGPHNGSQEGQYGDCQKTGPAWGQCKPR